MVAGEGEMQGTNGKVQAMLVSSNAYFIPPYQRSYQWEAERWQGLIQDVMEVATKAAPHSPHWLGVLLLSDEGPPHNPIDDSKATTLTVIDGQQRLVTLAIWLTALCDYAQDTDQESGFDASHLSEILVQASDAKSYQAARNGGWRDEKNFPLFKDRPLAAYIYFRWILWLGDAALLSAAVIKPPPLPKAPTKEWESYWGGECRKKSVTERLVAAGVLSPGRLEIPLKDLVTATRERLTVYSMVHQGDTDESQAVIFEALNGMRTELEPLDHVRNSLFVRIEKAAADDLYKKHWEPVETRLRKVSIGRMSSGTTYLYDYLISRGESKRQGPINARRAASHFARMTQAPPASDIDLQDFVKRDVLLAMAAWPCVVGDAPSFEHDGIQTKLDDRNRDLMRSIRSLSENPLNPLVLHYVMALARGELKPLELTMRLRTVESFLVRHLLAARPFSPLRSRIMELMASLYPSIGQEELIEALSGHGHDGWPTDADIQRVMSKRQLYAEAKPLQIGVVFHGIERQLSGTGALPIWVGKGEGLYTIEHIFPLNPVLEWTEYFRKWGVDERKVQGRVHCLGNLTVATQEFNSGMGNSTLPDKQAYSKRTGKMAPLKIHGTWLDSECWGDAEIDARGKFLLKTALEYWPVPLP